MRRSILTALAVVSFVLHGQAFAKDAETLRFLNRSTTLTGRDFEALSKAASEHEFIPKIKCKYAAKEEPQASEFALPDVFGDPAFDRRFSRDPAFQKIKLYLYFNEAAEIVPDDLLSQFSEYAKAFYLLYRHGLVLSPDLSKLTHEQAGPLTEFYLDDRTPTFRTPRTEEERLSYQTVINSDLKLPSKVAWPSRFSAAMIQMMAKIAQYQSSCQMTTAETTALGIYVGMGFRKLNPYLRERGVGRNARFDLLEALTNRALDKIADLERIVFRTTRFWKQPDMPEAIYHQHTSGSLLRYDAFTSTSANSLSDSNFLIYSRTGKLLGDFSIESEVLFKSHSKFLVRYNSCEEQNLQPWQGCKVILEELPAI